MHLMSLLQSTIENVEAKGDIAQNIIHYFPYFRRDISAAELLNFWKELLIVNSPTNFKSGVRFIINISLASWNQVSLCSPTHFTIRAFTNTLEHSRTLPNILEHSHEGSVSFYCRLEWSGTVSVM